MWSKVFFVILVCHGVHCGKLDLLGLASVDLPITDTLVNAMKKDKPCVPSKTIYTNGLHPCQDQVIFEDDFQDNFVNRNKWILEKYIPVYQADPDYEFVSYDATDETLFIRNGTLIVNPVAITKDEEVRGALDLREGCTSVHEEQCFYQQVSAYILPPVKSAKISTKFSFTYGRVDVKAKLPQGDWIYPQIQLLPRIKSKIGAKFWIAYSRGNTYYIGPNGDVGNTALLGGLVLGIKEPERSRFASKRKAVVPYGDVSHTYSLIWEPDRITVLYNNETYGVYPVDQNDSRFSPFSNEFYLSIGIGVGGINDFPDNYTSNSPKPWVNMDRNQVRNFFDARNTWLQTWKKENIQLKIDSVKIRAL